MRKPSFITSLTLHRSVKSGITPYRCPSHPVHPSHRTVPTRLKIVARVRRGRKPSPEIPETLYDAEQIPDIDCKPFDFSTLRGRVVLIVNVASTDDYTDRNYKSFADLLEKYQDDGFEIIAFPSNWYGQFETGTFEEIKKFVHTNYSNRIKLMAKTDLEWNQAFALGRKYFPGEVIWNFHGKFLFGRKGLPVARFDLLTTHDYLEGEVRRYINSSDPTIHDNTPPDPNTVPDDDDITIYSQNEVRKSKDEDDSDDVEEVDDEEDEEDEDDEDEDEVDEDEVVEDVNEENDTDDEDSVDVEDNGVVDEDIDGNDDDDDDRGADVVADEDAGEKKKVKRR